MRATHLILSAALLAPLATAAPVPKAIKKVPDPERIQGAWDIELAEHNGRPFSKAIWSFDGEKMTSRSRPEDAGSSWGYRLDPAQSPKHFDLTDTTGRSQYPGIYEFDGEKLKIAYTLGGERPTEFKSSERVYLNVLVRAKEQPSK
jgi:uncharacterized protein (TIGR03067 family)